MNASLSKEEVFGYVSKITNEQNEQFKRLMRDARLRNGWRTQEDAGKAIGVSQSLISSFESRGLYDGMRFLDFRKVLKAYSVSWSEIERIFSDPDTPPETRNEQTREILLRKFNRIPEGRREEAIRALEMLLEGYAR